MRILYVCLVLIFAFILPATIFAEPVPKIEVKQAEFDFGEIFQGDKVNHTFVFYNRGEAPLVIDRVKSSCGCTAALLSSKQILPGEEGTIKATFDSARFQGDIHKAIMLYSNAPGAGSTRFTIKGKVKPVAEADPERVDFGKIKIGSEKRLSFTMINRWDKELKIENVRTSNTAVSALTDADALSPGAPVTFTVVARPVESSPHLRGYVLIRTDYAVLGEIRVPIQGVIIRE